MTLTAPRQQRSKKKAGEPTVDAAAPASAIPRLPGFRADPLAVLGVFLITLLGISAAFAPLLAPHDPLAIAPLARLQPPSWDHPLGTDQLGRDLLSRVLYGGRTAMVVALGCVTLALTGGVLLGLLAGYGPRWLDNALLLAFDVVRSFPLVILALVMLTLTGPSIATVMAVIVVAKIPDYARIVRAQTQIARNATYIAAERAMAVPMPRIMLVHLLPNVIGPVFVLAAMDIPVVITIEAGLSFLGLGVRPPQPSWGTMLRDGFSFIRNTVWPILAGSLPLVMITLGFTFLGEALRDRLDPRGGTLG